MHRLRTWLALAALVAIAAGSFQPMYLRIFTADPVAMSALFTELPYRRLPGLRRLLVEMNQRLPAGSRVAFWAPFREWEGGYGYAFRRAPYLLPGKRVLPMLEPDRDQPTARYLPEAEYVVCWRQCPSIEHFRVVWRSADGELMARIR